MSLNFLELFPLVVHLIQCKSYFGTPLRYMSEAKIFNKDKSNDTTCGLSMYCMKAIEQNANTNIILMHTIYNDYSSRMPDIYISQM